ncbi:MAG: aldo/keto reductase, partial [Proteobacteria bacterium SW_6_67_9]
IAATSDPDHAADNIGAARGPLPDQAQRHRLAAAVDGG